MRAAFAVFLQSVDRAAEVVGATPVNMRIASIMLIALIQCGTTPPATKTVSAKTTMTITGTVTREGVECPAVRGDDGKLYTIVGEGRDKLKPGLKVRITGAVAEVSACMQGITIEATKIEVLTAES